MTASIFGMTLVPLQKQVRRSIQSSDIKPSISRWTRTLLSSTTHTCYIITLSPKDCVPRSCRRVSVLLLVGMLPRFLLLLHLGWVSLVCLAGEVALLSCAVPGWDSLKVFSWFGSGVFVIHPVTLDLGCGFFLSPTVVVVTLQNPVCAFCY